MRGVFYGVFRAPPVVGWPPVCAFRRNLALPPKPEMESKPAATPLAAEAIKKSQDSMYVKVNLEGYAVGRKINLKAHDGYESLSHALQKMFDNFFLDYTNLFVKFLCNDQLTTQRIKKWLMMKKKKKMRLNLPNMFLFMKTMKVTECWSATYHGSETEMMNLSLIFSSWKWGELNSKLSPESATGHQVNAVEKIKHVISYACLSFISRSVVI
ncbi:hypothetical protein HHK36_004548 [Tetracentron sinense]|uniref:Auxin-responsive protein n=1 Tax=Tetracentron sinense TaxID=13715 RepID=A0A834ZQ84_TETSI|nr:hypothetical protein HHK36_004548 [Tetracentron sinense]